MRTRAGLHHESKRAVARVGAVVAAALTCLRRPYGWMKRRSRNKGDALLGLPLTIESKTHRGSFPPLKRIPAATLHVDRDRQFDRPIPSHLHDELGGTVEVCLHPNPHFGRRSHLGRRRGGGLGRCRREQPRGSRWLRMPRIPQEATREPTEASRRASDGARKREAPSVVSTSPCAGAWYHGPLPLG